MILKRAIWYPLEELELAQHMSMALLTDCLRFFAVAVGAHVPRRGLSVSLLSDHPKRGHRGRVQLWLLLSDQALCSTDGESERCVATAMNKIDASLMCS